MKANTETQDLFLFLASHQDLKKASEKKLYRLLEMLPGFLTLTTLISLPLISWKAPFFAATFIILFDLYWFLRVIYFSTTLYSGYKKMRKNLKVNWLAKLEALKKEEIKLKGVSNYKEILHLVVFPIYQEPYKVVQESLEALVSQNYPKDKIVVVLAVEKRSSVWNKDLAEKIQNQYKDKFLKFFVVFHPDKLPGEIACKGANETFALKKIKKEFLDQEKIPLEKVLLTSLDADTCLFPQYLACLTYKYLTTKNPLLASYQPIPLYINNIFEANFFSRVIAFSSTFWHTMNQERPDKLITFSSHSMPFKALVDAGFKQVNVISEDSRIFWQCFFAYQGNYRTIPLYYPVSMDAVVSKSFFKTLKNIYKQQRRWAYGMENIPYVIFNFLQKRAKLTKRGFKLLFELVESNWSWATAPLIIFFMGFLPVLLGGERFNQTLLSYNLPRVTSNLLTFSMVAIPLLMVISFQTVSPVKDKRKILAFIFQWLTLPLVMIFFSAIPAIDAQLRWFFNRRLEFETTPKLR